MTDLPPAAPIDGPGVDRGRLQGAAPLGLALLLVSLGILFLATLVGFFFVRASVAADKTWPPPGLPALPIGMWIATAVLLLTSAALHVALVAAKRDQQLRLFATLAIASVAGAAFLILQGDNWHRFLRPLQDAYFGRDDAHVRWLGQFYVLTVLHGLHVIGGLIPLWITTWRARSGRYGPERTTGVLMCAMYWHFLDAVWVVIFAALLFA